MSKMGFKRNLKPIEVLDESQLAMIREGITKVLVNTGATFEDEQALKFLESAGCKVDYASKRVRFTEKIINDCLEQTPSRFTVAARDPENNWLVGQDDFSYIGSSCALNSVDLDTWQPKEPTRKDFYDFIKVLDYLPNVHGILAFPYFGFAKVPQAMRLIESMAAKMRMTTKVCSEGSVMGNDHWIIEMGKLAGMDLIQLVNPVAPLTNTKEVTDKISDYAQKGVPFWMCSGPVGGATGPATIAGSLTTCTAEHLSGIIYAQLIKPGTKVLNNNQIMLQNMNTGSPYFAQAGNLLIDAAYNQLWRSYGVPTTTVSASWTSSKAIDFQAAYETAMAAMVAAYSGADVVWYQGGGAQQLTAHPIKAIMDDDVAGMIIRFMRGIDVSDETVATDLINEVGPLPGNFLSTSHTRKWWKQEQYLPKVADSTSFSGWVKGGSKTMFDKAREKFEFIISKHQPVALSAQIEQAVEDILQDARKYYRDHGMITDEEWRVYQEDLNSPNYPYA
jgi:trimethylamine--corrinoid protein Co-methyltransferase